MATSPRLMPTRGLVEVDVGPAQPEELAATHAGHCRQPERGEQSMAGGGPQEQAELFGGPCLLFDLGDRPQPWCVGDEGDVAVDQPAADGVVEGAADDEVDLVDGLRCQCPAAVGGVQHPVVQLLEVVGPQRAQPGGAEGGEDVPLGLVDVAAVGARAQGQLLAGQPPAGQVGAEGERSNLVIASVALIGEAFGEAFGLGPIDAGRVPGPALPAGDGVETLVDDGVVAAPLGRDVTLHGSAPLDHQDRCDPVERSVEQPRSRVHRLATDRSSLAHAVARSLADPVERLRLDTTYPFVSTYRSW